MTLRPLTEADTPQTLAWRNQDRVRTAFVTAEVLSPDQHRRWFDAYAERDDDFVFIVEERGSGAAVGQIALYAVDWMARTATFGRLYIGEDSALGRGLATEATGLILDWARRLGLREIRLEVFRGNRRAVELYRKAGFETYGAQSDLLFMRRRLRPRHSVIVGSYNRPRLVSEAIVSVLEQTDQDFELIVSDDGSNGETLSAIRALTDHDPRCRLLTVEHVDDSLPRPDCQRRAVQRINNAIKVLTGDLVHYLADDDLFAVNRFEIFDALFADPVIVVGYGRLLYIDADGAPTGESRYSERVEDPRCVLDQNQVAHRAQVFEHVPGWTEVDHYESDGEFFRALSRRWPFHGVDRVVGSKRLHALNMQNTMEHSTGKREF